MSTVTIIIPSYNSAHYLPDALDSCFAQTYKHIEVIVVDDGSTDDPRAVVAKYPGVRFIRRENGGIAAARNTGIAAASGEYLQFLDADDTLHPAKLEQCIAAMTPDTTVVYTDYEIRTPDMSAPYANQRPNWHMPEGGKEIMLPALLKQISVPFVPGCAFLRSDAVRRVGGFYNDVRFVEDFPFWIKMAASGAVFRYVPEKLYLYRYTTGSVSKRELVMAEGRLRAFQKLRTIDGIEKYVNLRYEIAERHHVLAMKLWRHGKRQEARKHFRAAIRESAGRHGLRRGLIALTYIAPAPLVERALNGLGNVLGSARSHGRS
jgi:glycosyltransferase involved in cell wall biosynthesis